MARQSTGGTSGTGAAARLLAVVLALGLAATQGCGSDAEPSASSDSVSTITGEPTATSATSAAPGGTAAILDRLATAGAATTFEKRFAGEVADPLTSTGKTPLVLAGRSGSEAVVYICDGEQAGWYTGIVDDDGSGSLKATNSDATVLLTAVGEGLNAVLEGGPFSGLSVALGLDDKGTETLLRVQVPLEDDSTAVGGVIIGAAGIRGVVAISGPQTAPSTPASLGQIVSRTPAGLLTIRATPPPASTPTTTTTLSRTTTTRRASTTTTVGPVGGAGPSGVPPSVPATTPSGSVLSQCASLIQAAAASIDALRDELEARRSQLAAVVEQRAVRAAEAQALTGTQRDSRLQQVAALDAVIATLRAQIDAIQAQIEELERQLDVCQEHLDRTGTP